jgi:hypothetical protein
VGEGWWTGGMSDYFIGFLDYVRPLFNAHRIFVRASLLNKYVFGRSEVLC